MFTRTLQHSRVRVCSRMFGCNKAVPPVVGRFCSLIEHLSPLCDAAGSSVRTSLDLRANWPELCQSTSWRGPNSISHLELLSLWLLL